jgi:hypothetical protein
VGAAALVVSACAAVPDSGPVQAGSVALSASGQSAGQDYLQLIAAPPKPGLGPLDIVRGFLVACASFADNHAVARQYLDPSVRDSWNPGWAVTVVSGTPRLTPPVKVVHQAGPYTQAEEVKATGEKLATLTATGQYVGAQGSSFYPFYLVQAHGQWRIQDPPPRLLLPEPDFKRVYAPRNLYFLAGLTQALVPDPVFVPQQATYVDLANKLVTALLSEPQGWLANAVSTAFPAGTVLLRKVTIAGGTATVDLGGSAAGAGGDVLSQMTSQLIWTLAGPSYAQSGIQSVDLEINGRLRQAVGLPNGRPSLSPPAAASRTPLYAITASGSVQKLTGSLASARNVPGQAGEASAHLASIAVSPDGRYVVGLTRSGRGVYYGPLRPGGRLARWKPSGVRFTSLSWDASDELWVAGPAGVWMLRPGSPAIPLGNPPPGVVSQLRVAPDGVRVAMIVHSPGAPGPQLLLAAIRHVLGGGVVLGTTVVVGDDVPSPTQLTWYDADNLIALSHSPAGQQLREVPVNGGSSTTLVTDPGTQSISAAGPANPLAAGLSDGQLALTSRLDGTWMTGKGTASSPAYPG